MIVPKAEIEKAALQPGETDYASKPALQNVYLRGDWLEATNGLIVARVPVTRAVSEIDGAVAPLALKLAREQSPNKSAPQLDLGKQNYAVVPGVMGINRTQPVTQPPTFEELKAKLFHPDEGETWRVALDVRYLYRLAEALGSSTVVLELSVENPLAPIHVLHREGVANGEGLLMPARNSQIPETIEPAPAAEEAKSDE